MNHFENQLSVNVIDHLRKSDSDCDRFNSAHTSRRLFLTKQVASIQIKF